MNSNTYLIERNDIEQAQEISRFIDRPDVRNRATANILAVNIASKLFDNSKFNIDISSGLHNLDFILDKYDVADIYVNGTYIDVRVAFNENELAVPSSHFKNGLLPVAYMFLKLSRDLDNAEVLGFVLPEEIHQTTDHEYINIDQSLLKSFYDIEPLLRELDDLDEISEKQIFDFIDGQSSDEIAVLKEFVKTKSGRSKLIKAYKAKRIFNYISKTSAPIEEKEEVLEEQDDLMSEAPIEDFSLDAESDLDNFEIQDLEASNSLEEVADLETFEVQDLESFNTVDEISETNSIDAFEIENLGEESAQEEDSMLIEAFEDDNPEENTIDFDNKEEVVEKQDEEDTETFSTVTTPSFNFEDELDEQVTEETAPVEIMTEIEPPAPEEVSIEDNFGTGFEISDLENEDIIEDLTNSNSDVIEDYSSSDAPENTNNEEIQTLFEAPQEENVAIDETVKPKKSIGILPIAALAIALIGGGLYWGYNKFNSQQDVSRSNLPNEIEKSAEPINVEEVQPVAMPVETVDNTNVVLNTEEGTSESIPAIEQNLDASILVSNLKVDWEVPSGYASNTAAKRYLLKLGKIIQFNLKTELLLLNKPPISNKIAVEIQYNESSGKFEAAGIRTSSGENEVDKLIMNVINNALAMNLNMNTDSFKNLNAHPVLIIKL